MIHLIWGKRLATLLLDGLNTMAKDSFGHNRERRRTKQGRIEPVPENICVFVKGRFCPWNPVHDAMQALGERSNGDKEQGEREGQPYAAYQWLKGIKPDIAHTFKLNPIVYIC